MRLKNVLITVKDMDRATHFYHELFGLNVVLDQGDNVVLTEGLVLQSKKVWEESLGIEVITENHASELYFEEKELEKFVGKLESQYPSTRYVNRLMTYSWGQKMVRFYDLDGNLIEVRTPME
ncbi:MAG: VOC family protein [Lachnospiraceae bacterium]|nr:VOC family protein [Lachnospiraceae bacterium]